MRKQDVDGSVCDEIKADEETKHVAVQTVVLTSMKDIMNSDIDLQTPNKTYNHHQKAVLKINDRHDLWWKKYRLRISIIKHIWIITDA